jgi:hypothetical protein
MWTKDVPTKAGWYWYKNGDYLPDVIHVGVLDYGSKQFAVGIGPKEQLFELPDGVYFSEPIKEPLANE